jgi:hypothetical protein
METCAYRGWRFWRQAPAGRDGGGSVAEARRGDGHLVTCAAFTFATAYRGADRYARGLQGLAEAVRTHLPSFTLRVYVDASVDPDTLRARGEADAAAAWAETLAWLLAQPHVSVVWFEHARFVTPDRRGHVELFGTFARFVPLFAGGGDSGGLPHWAAAPPAGRVVFSSDVDFGDFATEHAALHALRWYADRADAAAAAAGTGGGSDLPQVLALAAAGSAAARHSPSCGLPPFYSGLFAARARFPLEWLDRFLDDAAALVPAAASSSSAAAAPSPLPPSVLAARYLAAVHDPATAGSSMYTKRRLGDQRTVMPFGVDEFFLTTVLKAGCIARGVVAVGSGGGGSAAAASVPQPQQQPLWLFLIIPAVDAEVSKLLVLLAAGLARDPSVGSHPSVQAMVEGLALAAGKAADASAARPLAAAQPPAYAAAVAAWKDAWPKAAAARVALWERFSSQLDVLDASKAGDVAAGLRAAMAGAASAMAVGVLPHVHEDLEQAQQNLAFLAGEPAGGALAAPLLYRVGGGVVAPVPPAEGRALTGSLLDALRTARGCGVPKPDRRAVAAAADAAAAAQPGGVYRGPLARLRAGTLAAVDVTTGVGGAGGAGRKRPREGEEEAPPSAAAAAPAAATTAAAPAAAAATAYPGWEARVSRSTGNRYYFHAGSNQSLWHDDSLPPGWAWGRAGDGAPRYFVHLGTGERRAEPPQAANG